MKFISQTAADANGNYTMTWKDQDGNTVITEHNLFNIQKSRDIRRIPKQEDKLLYINYHSAFIRIGVITIGEIKGYSGLYNYIKLQPCCN